MKNIGTKFNFGNESIEQLIDEIIKDKINKTTISLKSQKVIQYKQSEIKSTNTLEKKVDEKK